MVSLLNLPCLEFFSLPKCRTIQNTEYKGVTKPTENFFFLGGLKGPKTSNHPIIFLTLSITIVWALFLKNLSF